MKWYFLDSPDQEEKLKLYFTPFSGVSKNFVSSTPAIKPPTTRDIKVYCLFLRKLNSKFSWPSAEVTLYGVYFQSSLSKKCRNQTYLKKKVLIFEIS